MKKLLKALKANKNLLVIMFVSIFLLVGGLVVGKISFSDKVAQVTGQDLASKIYADLKDELKEQGDELFGAAPGPDFYVPVALNSGFQTGGVLSTSTSGALLPLNVNDVDDVTLINVTLNQVDAEIRFPASTTLGSVMRNTGDTRTWFIRNASTTSAMDLKVASSTGIILNMGTTTNTIFGDTSPNKWAEVTLTRLANTDFIGLLEIYLNK